ncbi:sulfotransferase family protein [Jiella endophytica]|uniref:Sulfotransferase family protein n=1 Tax=Jiella endophytica TaxID=2558362 RepID=A0A4Y8RQL4_9HYPH|nr:sulfotransferase family protein [Jiella endophytica]TFF25591.1 sulfotransferase family protein [Jiella endophytica]
MDAVNVAFGERSPCPCRSGLSAMSCCEMDLEAARRVTPTPGMRQAVANAAAKLKSGHLERAVHFATAVLERAPLDIQALRTLASVRLEQNRQHPAAILLERIAIEDPFNFWAVSKLALLELSRQHYFKAEQFARQALRLSPTSPQSHNLMGVALTNIGKAAAGEYHHRKALELTGRRVPLVLANLALSLKNQGRMEEARELYREAHMAEKRNRQTLLAWAQLEEADRNLDAAKELLDKVEAISAPSPATRQTRAAILGREGRLEEALAVLDLDDPRTLRPIELLERGRLLDRMERYDEAWQAFLAGKAMAIRMGGRRYLQAEAKALAEQLSDFFSPERVAILPRARVRQDVAQPIFILGFPRSGTTLLEQSLSVSPDIVAGDELTTIHEIVAAMPRLLASPNEYPGALAEVWMGDKREELDSLRDYYLQRARQLNLLAPGARFFTDKMPLNEMHLGLIGLIFPKAPLIHMIRHPLDIMVSAMSNFFTHGGFCGSELETAAEHLVRSTSLVVHYRSVMELNYKAVRYEDVVGAQEATMRGVFDFIETPFDRRSLSFEENVRFARTASYAQVTERLYDRSRYRYRHYLRHLEPVLPVLEPLIAAWGYDV